MVQFGRMDETGRVFDEREISHESIQACRFLILVAEHYREDGSCRCDDAQHRVMIIREWEYQQSDFDGIPLREEE